MEGRVYIMENKDINTDYQKVVNVGDWKWVILEITIEFFFVWDSYFYIGSFQVPPEKNYPHRKCQFPPKNLHLI